MNTTSRDALTNDRQAVLTYLMNCRLLLKISIGAVVGRVVNHDYIVVHDAPAKAVSEIVGNFRMVELRADGLLIPLTPLPK